MNDLKEARRKFKAYVNEFNREGQATLFASPEVEENCPKSQPQNAKRAYNQSVIYDIR
jgi:hypothetical protein